MNRFVRRTSAAVALALLAPLAMAQVLTFDDIGASGPVPVNYGGLDWSGGAWQIFDTPQAPYTPHSGSFRAFAEFGAPDAAAAIRFPTPTPFQGAWFSGFDLVDLHFELFLGGALVATSASLTPSDVPTFLSSGYAGAVDTVVVTAGGQNFFTMDDFTLGAVTPAIPEPRTYVLMALGLAVIGLFLFRRRGD
ncbi:MAG TPA: PEP-CTERM sorting domain-containing protein [Albitalea sp.]|uniref:PEP-CTERM sorting domain-containing protein n=1 Tax=Piscinibacter sp. TaxID=1903157 RepID=UPI002ED5358C